MNKQKNAFTIIEVVLVLAIAGLIFMMVFLALPALQRSQRDTQRKNDLNRFMAALNQYQANNRGRIPADGNTIINDYLLVGEDTFEDPTSGANYNVFAGQVQYTDADGSTIGYNVGSVCTGEDAGLQGGQGGRKVAVVMPLEGGGAVCQNN